VSAAIAAVARVVAGAFVATAVVGIAGPRAGIAAFSNAVIVGECEDERGRTGGTAPASELHEAVDQRGGGRERQQHFGRGVRSPRPRQRCGPESGPETAVLHCGAGRHERVQREQQHQHASDRVAHGDERADGRGEDPEGENEGGGVGGTEVRERRAGRYAVEGADGKRTGEREDREGDRDPGVAPEQREPDERHDGAPAGRVQSLRRPVQRGECRVRQDGDEPECDKPSYPRHGGQVRRAGRPPCAVAVARTEHLSC
jgi:hypothetical protein